MLFFQLCGSLKLEIAARCFGDAKSEGNAEGDTATMFDMMLFNLVKLHLFDDTSKPKRGNKDVTHCR